MYIELVRPEFLLFLLAVPLIILIHFYALKSSKKKAMKFANFESIGRVKGVDIFSKNIVILILSLLIVILIVLAVSGMTLHYRAESSSFSFVLAIDSSSSMETDDFSPNRLEAAKSTAIDFIETSPIATRVGVISFSGDTYIEQEITDEKPKIKNSIENIQTKEVSGTDIYEAIVTSTNLLRKEDTRSIILLSDGQVTVGDIETAIEYANRNDVIVHTIAIGTEEGGEASYGLSKLDKETLKSIAYHTEGEFFQVEDKQEFSSSLEEVTKNTEKEISSDLSSYLLIGAIVLFLVKYYLMNTRYRTLP